MRKTIKLRAILIVLLASVFMFAASALTANIGNVQAADAGTEKVFVMAEDVQVRKSNPSGLRFRVYLNETVKKEVDNADEFGFIIAPTINFEHAESLDYLADGAMVDKAVVPVSPSSLTKEQDGDRYFVNAVLYNIHESNWSLNFSAVAFYKAGSTTVYTDSSVLPSANIGELLDQEFFSPDGNAETRAQLIENFNYGSAQSKTVSSPIVGEYTIPAHPIDINSAEDFIFAATLPVNNCAFELTEDVVVSDTALDANSPLQSTGNTFATEFAGILDGNGYTLTLNINTENQAYFNGVFKNISGTIKNLNVVMSIRSPYTGSDDVGLLAKTLNGTIENCIINYTNEMGSGGNGYGYASLIANMGADAEIKNTIVNMQSGYVWGGVITEKVQSTSKITNVAVVSNYFHYPNLFFGVILPESKCAIDGLYVYNSISNLISGKADYVLDSAKYEACENPQFSYAQDPNVSSADQIAALYTTGPVNKTAAEIVGSRVASITANILKKSGATTVNAVAFAGTVVSVSLDRTKLEISENSSPIQLNATALFNGQAVDSSEITWSTSSSEIATVSGGLVTPVKAGIVTITATYFGVSATCTITITEHWNEINNLSQFISAMSGTQRYRLNTDITITDTALDANSTFQSRGNCFSTFAGTLDGDGHIVTFNVNTEGLAYFNGVYGSISGLIKNTNFVVNVRTPYIGSHGIGVLTQNLTGTIDGCIITTTNHYASGYGYASLFGTLGANAQIKNTLINAIDFYMAGGLIAEYASETSKITNVAFTSNLLHYPDRQMGMILPLNKCNIDGLYIYNNVSNIVLGEANFVLDADKYASITNPQFTYNADADIDQLYARGPIDKPIRDILGRNVAVFSAPIVKNTGATTLNTVMFIDESLVDISIDTTSLELDEKSSPVQITATASYAGVPASASDILWSSNDEKVVTVSNGLVTVVDAGQATIFATYCGVTVKCIVNVAEVWNEISTAEELISIASKTDRYRLTSDIVITDKFIDTTSAYGGSNITSDFYAVLDGAGHTVTFNIDTSGQAYFNGAFRFIYGAVKNTNFVVNMSSPVSNGGDSRGVLAYRVYGAVENCIVNVKVTKTSGDYGYWSVFGELGENAVINNVVVKAVSSYMAGGAIAKIVQPTSKVSNFVLISNNLGWADMTLASVLPTASKCDITNLYVYDNIVPSGYNLKLDEAKYQAEGAPYNITWTVSNCADSNIDVLYSRNANMAIADIVGFDVMPYDAPIITKSGTSTIPALNFYDLSFVEIELSTETLSLNEKSAPTQIGVTATYAGAPIDSSKFSWSSSNEDVVTVVDGLVTVVGVGSATITFTCYGVSKTCQVNVAESWINIATAEQLIEQLTANPTDKYRLVSNISVTDASLNEDGTYQSSGYHFSSDFTGVLDGDGYTITFNINTRVGNVTHYSVFNTVSGTIKNINIIININTYYRGGQTGLFIGRLNGTIENSIITYDAVSFGNYGYPSMIHTLGDNAEIKNSVVNVIGDVYADYLIARNASATTKLTNVWVVSTALGWTAKNGGMYLAKLLPSTKCDINGLYASTNIANALNGKAYVSLNKTKYEAEDTPANITWTSSDCDDENILVLYDMNVNVSMESVLGYKVSSRTVTVPKGTLSGGVITEIVPTELTVIDFFTHRHEYGAWEQVIAPDCLNAGLEQRACTICGEKQTQAIEALGHNHADPVEENRQVGDCENGGSYESVVYCSVCKVELDRQLVQIEGGDHAYVDTVIAPTKTEKGYTIHNCSVCGDEKIDSYVSETGSLGLVYTQLQDGTYQLTSYGTCTDTEVVIPTEYNGARVSSIAQKAFYANVLITSVVIPEGVNSIGEKAFARCASLSEFVVSNNNASFKVIDNNLYSKDGTVLVQYAISNTATTFDMPDTVKTVRAEAFYGQNTLMKVVASSTLTTIGEAAFRACARLNSIVLPATVDTIETYALDANSTVKVFFEGTTTKFVGDNYYLYRSSLPYEEGNYWHYDGENIVIWPQDYIISFNYNNLQFKVSSESVQLVVNITINGSIIQSPEGLVWSSTNNRVAVVYNGLVTPKGVGNATIKVTYKGMVKECDVVVEDDDIQITLDKTSLSLSEDSDPVQLLAYVVKNGQSISSPVINWKSTNVNVVEVANGLVTVYGAGSANVTATYGNETVTCSVTVSQVYTQITSSSQFINYMKNSPSGKYKLMTDVTVSDTKLDPSSSIQTTSYTFNNTFSGVLNGNGYTVTFNINGEGSYTYGIYKTVSGTIKNTTFVISHRTTYQASNHPGILIKTLNGKIENCIINLTNQLGSGGSGYGYASTVQTMGASAEIKNTVINVYNGYIAGSLTAEAVNSTSKLTNVFVISNRLHYNDYQFRVALPSTKCNVNGFYVYNNMDEALSGVAPYALNATKYANGPANVDYVSDSDLDTLYDKNVSVSIASTIGMNIYANQTTILKASGAETMNILSFVSPYSIFISLNKTYAEVDEKSGPFTLTPSAVVDGRVLSSIPVIWSSSDESVATVSNGVVTIVGRGITVITATYYGISASCEVMVSEYVGEIHTAAEFIDYMTNGNTYKYKLMNDITISDKSIDSTSTYQSNGTIFTGDFSGEIDGNGNTITFNINTRVGNVTHYYIFNTVSGTIKNTNVIINLNTYFRGGETGFFISTLNGRIEDCVISYDNSKFGNYGYPSLINKLGPNSEIKDTVINVIGNFYGDYLIAKNASSTSKLTNIILVSSVLGWTTSTNGGYFLGKALPATKCDVNGFYTARSVTDAINGTIYASLNATKYTNSSTPANITFNANNCSDEDIQVLYDINVTINPKQIIGHNIGSKIVSLPKAEYNGTTNTITSITYQDIAVIEMAISACDAGHSYDSFVSNGNNTHTSTCSRDASHTIIQNCSGGTATCTERAICEYCNTAYGEVLGHDYTEWKSNGDGTHTMVCLNDESHSITESCFSDVITLPIECSDCGYKLNTISGGLGFKTLVLYDEGYVTSVSRTTETFNFEQEIMAIGNYRVCTDELGQQEVNASAVPLAVGRNNFYVFEQVDNLTIKYKVIIIRNIAYEVTFYNGEDVYYRTVVERGAILSDIPADPYKDGYTFAGWDYDLNTAINANTIINAVYTANAGTPYRVEYYFEQKINGGAWIEDSMTEEHTAVTGEIVSVTPPMFDNYALNVDKSVLSSPVLADGSLVLEVYYYSTLIKSNAAFASTDIDLVKDGKTNYSIVIPEDAGKYVIFAAEELRDLFKRSTGIKLDIVTENASMNTSGYYLSLGETILQKQTGVEAPTTGVLNPFFVYQSDVQVMGEEGAFAIQRVNNTVIMVGIDDYGTVFAVYEFLEKQLGYRYYAASEIVIDKVSNEKLIDINWSYAPFAMRNRATDLMSSTTEAALRYRMIPNDVEMFSYHTWVHVLEPEVYAAEHPEWFNELQNAICLTNDEVVKEYAKQVLINFDKTGYCTHISGMSDQWSSHCQCANCVASDNIYTSSGTHVIFVNKVCNEIDRLLAEQGRPNFRYRINVLAYYMFEYPPVNEVNGSLVPISQDVMFHDNAGVMICLFRWTDASEPLTGSTINQKAVKEIEGWLACNPDVIETYVYRGYFPLYNLAFPFDWSNLKNWIVELKNYGSIYNTWSVPAQSQFEELRAFVHGQLCYDPTQNMNDLIDEFVEHYYKDAGPEVQQFFEEITSYMYMEHSKNPNFDLPTTSGDASHLINDKSYWSEHMLSDWNDLFEDAYESIENSDTLTKDEKLVIKDRIEQQALWPRYWFFKYYGDLYFIGDSYDKELKEILDLAYKYGYTTDGVEDQLTKDHFKS